MGVDVTAVDQGLEIHGAAGFALVDHHIVEGERPRGGPSAPLKPRRQERAPVLGILAREYRVDVFQHRIGADVGQESQPPAIDAEQWNRVAGHQARGVEQRAVPADHDHEIGAGGERGLRAGPDAALRELEIDPRINEGVPAASVKVVHQVNMRSATRESLALPMSAMDLKDCGMVGESL